MDIIRITSKSLGNHSDKITNLNQHLLKLREIDTGNEHPDSGMEQEIVRLMDELSIIPLF